MSPRPLVTAILLLACLVALPTIAATADAPLSAHALATAAKLRDTGMAGSQAYALVDSLTTEIGERLAGTPPADRAVEWAKAKFKDLGYDKVYTEPVTFPLWTRGAEEASVIAPYPQHLAITALGGSVGSKGAIEADVVEFATLDALKAARPGTLNGKIAYISYRMQRFKDGHDYGTAHGARLDGPSIGKLAQRHC